MAAVEAGHEFTVLPSCVRRVAGRRLKILKLRPALPPWSLFMLWRKDAETEPVRPFIAAALAKWTKILAGDWNLNIVRSFLVA